MPNDLRMGALPEWRILFQTAFFLSLLIYPLHGQVETSPPSTHDQPDSANVAEAVAAVKSGKFTLIQVETISAHAVQAIPSLEEQFATSHDVDVKGKIASALIRLGDEKSTYWDFLTGRVSDALKSDAPSQLRSDSQLGLSSQYIEWARLNNLSTEEAIDRTFQQVIAVEYLAQTKNARAIPLLREALKSNNSLIQANAAMGLAELQDKDSIDLIIEACKTSSPVAAAVMARALIDFDEPRAQKAVDLYLPKNYADAFRASRQKRKTP
jgi:HEAT repeats